MAVLVTDAGMVERDAGAAPVVPARSWAALVLLLGIYLLNYLDRTLIFILFGPIKELMKLTDLELALLGSTSFVIFYTLLGIPFGRIADKVSRTRMIAVGLVTWSVFSGLTGAMDTFTGIFLCRVMVGVGEATLGPAALSLLSDLFPPRMRATAGAIYSAGIPLGAGAALILGGAINDAWGWRWAFYMLGFPGAVLALLVLLVHEPARGISERPAGAPPAAAVDWRVLVRTPALWMLYAGYALMALAGNSLSMWIPRLMAQKFSMTLTAVGGYTGTAAALGGLVGTLCGGAAADAWRRSRAGGRMLFSAAAALGSIPLWLGLLAGESLVVMVACFGVLAGVALAWLGPAAADVQDVAGPKLRGLGIGIYFFIVNIIGYGMGPPLIGRLSDAMDAGTHPARMAQVLLVCPAAMFAAAVLLWAGARALERPRS